MFVTDVVWLGSRNRSRGSCRGFLISSSSIFISLSKVGIGRYLVARTQPLSAKRLFCPYHATLNNRSNRNRPLTRPSRFGREFRRTQKGDTTARGSAHRTPCDRCCRFSTWPSPSLSPSHRSLRRCRHRRHPQTSLSQSTEVRRLIPNLSATASTCGQVDWSP